VPTTPKDIPKTTGSCLELQFTGSAPECPQKNHKKTSHKLDGTSSLSFWIRKQFYGSPLQVQREDLDTFSYAANLSADQGHLNLHLSVPGERTTLLSPRLQHSIFIVHHKSRCSITHFILNANKSKVLDGSQKTKKLCLSHALFHTTCTKLCVCFFFFLFYFAFKNF